MYKGNRKKYIKKIESRFMGSDEDQTTKTNVDAATDAVAAATTATAAAITSDEWVHVLAVRPTKAALNNAIGNDINLFLISFCYLRWIISQLACLLFFFASKKFYYFEYSYCFFHIGLCFKQNVDGYKVVSLIGKNWLAGNCWGMKLIVKITIYNSK